MEDNWLDTVEALRTVSEGQWAELKLPMGLVNAIKKRLLSEVPQAQVGAPVQIAPVQLPIPV